MKYFDCEDLKEIGIWEQCPYCFKELTNENKIAVGTSPLRIVHYVGGKSLVYECPYCFEKSFCHYSEKLL